mmetsp:Transcript_14231/g.39477  ORF Transcript_14231/g.39477 Transcript_14231/m.39477 type:complete len:1298 (-) Transcript_14231:2626-6519(-)|eukprot:CAMPEP_0168729114 /NCGR_PEP_ID=MMETSP0724-20121128/6030_1 /TAXON_ID=265536 /ORGANISM="Amphiprora sp., Strain CCMP467" /LENGTH=1297 /DNA_ID=CAMNT_0008775975 /DNA_START=89 /DNA_END=3982 /DNA_ORIENTATION=-
MKPQEQDIARAVLKNIKGERYKDWNYLFLTPFDLSQVPGYLEIVGKPLDLQTVTQNFEDGAYGELAELWSDIKQTFENAMKYHSDRPTKWIAKMAKDMIKFFNKERKNAEKGKLASSSSPSTNKPKLKLGKQLPTAANVAAAQAKAAASGDSSGVSPPKPKKPKLKLKLKSGGDTAAPPDVALSTPSSNDTSKSNKSNKPKIRLKLKASNVDGGRNTPDTAASAAASTTSQSASEASKPASNKSSKGGTKISLKIGNSRGKELPKGVAQPPTGKTPPPGSGIPSASTSTTKTGQKRKRTSKKGASIAKDSPDGEGLPTPQLQACAKVLNALKRRHQKDISWFLSPVSDKSMIQDYRSKIKHPMDIGKMTSKVENKSYKSLADFSLDLRRIFSNCLCYNTSVKDHLRSVALELIENSEELMGFFFAQLGGNGSYPRLLYCWKTCMEALGTVFNLTNPTDGQPTCLYFLHPVKVYCGGQFPEDYLDLVKKPMDFQTVTSNLLEGRYKAVADFASDCKLIVQNCNTYYSGREDGRVFVEQANRLETVMNQQLEQLMRYDKSTKANSDRIKASNVRLSIPRPPVTTLTGILDDLRALNYTDKGTKITEAAMGPFEKPISVSAFPDYPQHVSEPMDLQTVERKAKGNIYATPEDFEYDLNLIFRNCERYNSQRNGEHLVSMAKFGAKHFRRLFFAKIAMPPPDAYVAPQQSLMDPAAKKQKLETDGPSSGKTAPRISITLSAAAASAAARSKSPKPGQPTQKKPTSPIKNQPVPLHIAIARVKEQFHLRRPVKSLQSWEADCARYFKELLRHPWLSAARPQFIFHVPVTMLFPDLREAYAAKIRKPMDLTTVECTLLAGNRYTSPEDLIEDVALTFSNAIRFNKDGRDIGDPLSCAYFDASVHLLRFARWLSLELLSAHVEKSDQVDECSADGLPPVSWKLTTGNRARAQSEQQEIVLKEPLDKSLEGDRFTWHESECEKLLKALRHQSDVKYMTFFIQPHYPSDYTTYISKPMDWEKVQKTLKKRQYDNFGQIVDDLRLIFKNALKYNARFKGTENVSGRAYAAAEYMSNKLETAVRKLMLSVSDRIERERIDHANAEREMDANERAEEARIRAAWKKDPNNKDGSSPVPSEGAVGPDGRSTSSGGRIRTARRTSVRKEITDFEIPYFDDEDDGQHEKSFLDLIKKQKAMFESQRAELGRMRLAASNTGSAIHSRLLQRNMARKWVATQRPPLPVPPAKSEASKEKKREKTMSNSSSDNKVETPSILKELERGDRVQIKISLGSMAKKKKKKRARPFDFDS